VVKAALLLVLLFSNLVQAASTVTVYRWVDDRGGIHFGDRASSAYVNTALQFKVAQPWVPEPMDILDLQVTAAEDSTKCADVTKVYNTLLDFKQTVTIADGGGEDRLLTAEERQGLVTQQKWAVGHYCTPAGNIDATT
jgi:hypothetical protein